MSREVLLDRAAEEDLFRLYEYIRDSNGEPTRGAAYIERIRRACLSLADLAERGVPRAERPGLRTMAFERSATIAYLTREKQVIVLRVLYRGQDVAAALKDTKASSPPDGA